MSNLSGYDSEVVGFSSITRSKHHGTSTTTQTTEFGETGASTQTNLTNESGCSVTPRDLPAGDILEEYPPGLNEFLRKVVPVVMEQLDQNDQELYHFSDSEDEETISAKLFQELNVKAAVSLGAGDRETPCVLSLSWSSAGNSLAISIGYSQHESWCNHDGLIKIFTIKRAAVDKLVHYLDINEKNCITVVKYHPSVAAILAYATTSGEVVICNLRYSMASMDFHEGMQLTSPAGCHGSRRVTSLLWADPTIANMYLTMQVSNTGKRRSASDQVLLSSGSDGTLNVWRVNSNSKVFDNVLCYSMNGSRKMAAPDISCFDFIKSYPLRPCDEKVADDIFVVGTKCGRLYLCKVKGRQLVDTSAVDPVYEMLEGHATCVLDVAFSFQRPGLFASVSMDSELRLYDVTQTGPLKVLCLDTPATCMCWLPNNPCVVILGAAGDSRDKSQALRVYNASSGRAVPISGLTGGAVVTAIAVNQHGSCQVAAGDADGAVRVWELPTCHIRPSADEF